MSRAYFCALLLSVDRVDAKTSGKKLQSVKCVFMPMYATHSLNHFNMKMHDMQRRRWCCRDWGILNRIRVTKMRTYESILRKRHSQKVYFDRWNSAHITVGRHGEVYHVSLPQNTIPTRWRRETELRHYCPFRELPRLQRVHLSYSITRISLVIFK